MDYLTLTNADLLQQARDALRGAESDHYRLSTSRRGYNAEVLAQVEEDMAFYRAEVERLEALVEADAGAKAKQPEHPLGEHVPSAAEEAVQTKKG